MFSFSMFLNRIKLKICLTSSNSFLINYPKTFSTYSTHKPWKLVFYGTDNISVMTLKSLNLNRKAADSKKVIGDIDVVCIKSSCAVRKYAVENGLNIYTWPYNLPPNVYDVGVVVSFGHLLPAESILACKYGIINAHPSLLPRWRGAAPIIHTVLNGDKETGVTIVEVSPNKFDVGNILLQEKYKIPIDSFALDLTVTLSKMAAEMILKVLSNLQNYKESGLPQAKDGKTYAYKIKTPHGNVNWEQDSTAVIWRKYKAFNGCVDIYTHWEKMKVVISEFVHPDVAGSANVSSLITEMNIAPGFCYFHKKRKILFVKCPDGWCGIRTLRIPKTGKLTAQQFYNGYVSKVSSQESYFHHYSNKIS